jgi:hypothetical protein
MVIDDFLLIFYIKNGRLVHLKRVAGRFAEQAKICICIFLQKGGNTSKTFTAQSHTEIIDFFLSLKK